MQYSEQQETRSDLKLDQNPYFATKKCFQKSDSVQFSLSGWVLDLSKINIFYIKMFVSMRRIFYLQHLTKFQRLWRQNQAQRYLSLKNRVFHAYDRPNLAWLAMLVFAIVNLISDQLLV